MNLNCKSITMSTCRFTTGIFLVLLCWSYSTVEVTGQTFSFASYYQDFMVLQRAPYRAVLWGYGVNEGDEVEGTLALSSGALVQLFQANVVREGSALIWRVLLNPEDRPGPYDITVTSNEELLVLTNVLFGDVWLCSGEDNMAYNMSMISNADEEIADRVNYGQIRTFKTSTGFSASPQIDIPGVAQSWIRHNSGSDSEDKLKKFSAVCWLFAKHLYDQLQVPIGVIQSTWGATRIEAWSSPAVNDVCYGEGGPPPGNGNDQNNASALHNAMVHPWMTNSIYGAIWYHGERSNSDDASQYYCMLRHMLRDWRSSWYNKTGGTDEEFPFGIVQVANQGSSDTVDGFPELRWAQSGQTGKLPNSDFPNTFMAVAMDLPDPQSPKNSIMPRYKQQVAQRLSLAALGVAYNQGSVGRYQGPVPTAYQLVDVNGESALEITMDDGSVSLQWTSHFAFGFEICCSTDNPSKQCTNDWVMAPTIEVVTGKVNVLVTCEGWHTHITGVRYAWRSTPVLRLMEGHLYSVENSLPAPPFLFNGNVANLTETMKLSGELPKISNSHIKRN